MEEARKNHELERRPTQKDLEWARLLNRGQVFTTLARHIGQAIVVASFGIPLYILSLMTAALAGRVTQVNIAIGLAIGGSAFTAWIVHYKNKAKQEEQAKELVRLRAANEMLREQLKELKAEAVALRNDGKSRGGKRS